YPPFAIIAALLLGAILIAQPGKKRPDESASVIKTESQSESEYDSLFAKYPKYLSDGFDFPVGKPDAKGYYNAQPFMKNTHLGDDWNGRGGGNTDFGDPVYAIANGYVSEATDVGGGWGNVIRIVHKNKSGKWRYVESLYAHFDKKMVKNGDFVFRGAQIGTIGNNSGMYWAHLHLELRHSPDLPLGGGYSSDTTGYLDPTHFIKQHRPKR
ncbi:MAG TPA: M23 family metallopeptidase, partial [Saprospiraceae bacterium]|nr:M23 family metallopeptidase [Saprospiraceae bacterium]